MGTMLVVAAAAIVSVGSAAGVSVGSEPLGAHVDAGQLSWFAEGEFDTPSTEGMVWPAAEATLELTRTAGTDEFALSIVATITSEQTNTDSLCVFNTTRTFEGTGTFWFGGLQFEGEELLGIESPNCPGSNRALADPSPNSGGVRRGRRDRCRRDGVELPQVRFHFDPGGAGVGHHRRGCSAVGCRRSRRRRRDRQRRHRRRCGFPDDSTRRRVGVSPAGGSAASEASTSEPEEPPPRKRGALRRTSRPMPRPGPSMMLAMKRRTVRVGGSGLAGWVWCSSAAGSLWRGPGERAAPSRRHHLRSSRIRPAPTMRPTMNASPSISA